MSAYASTKPADSALPHCCKGIIIIVTLPIHSTEIWYFATFVIAGVEQHSLFFGLSCFHNCLRPRCNAPIPSSSSMPVAPSSQISLRRSRQILQAAELALETKVNHIRWLFSPFRCTDITLQYPKLAEGKIQYVKAYDTHTLQEP